MKFLETPTILFNKKFDDESLALFLSAFYELEEAGEDKINILINSPGGSVDALKTMIDVIYNTEMHVTTIATGQAASCGFLLLLVGDHRMAFDGTMLMSHQYSWGSRGKHHELAASRKAQDMTHRFMLDIYKRHTGLSENKITQELLPAEDIWISAEEALALRVIDEVIYPTTSKPLGYAAKQKYKEKFDKCNATALYNIVKDLGADKLEKLLKDIKSNEAKAKKTSSLGEGEIKKGDKKDIASVEVIS